MKRLLSVLHPKYLLSGKKHKFLDCFMSRHTIFASSVRLSPRECVRHLLIVLIQQERNEEGTEPASD